MLLGYIGSRCFYAGLTLDRQLSGISRSVFFCPLRVFSWVRFCHQPSSFFFWSHAPFFSDAFSVGKFWASFCTSFRLNRKRFTFSSLEYAFYTMTRYVITDPFLFVKSFLKIFLKNQRYWHITQKFPKAIPFPSDPSRDRISPHRSGRRGDGSQTYMRKPYGSHRRA